jgi:hypothetical protein
MQILSNGTVFTSRPRTNRQSCAFPTICALPNGRWLAGCRAAPTKDATTGQHVLISWSDNFGTSWSDSIQPFAPPTVDGKPGLFRSVGLTSLSGDQVLAALYWVDHADPALPFFNEDTEGLLDSRIFWSASENGGESWSTPILMDTSPFNVPTPITGPALLLPDGRLACQFETNKHYHDTSVWRHSSVLMFSSDAGATWPDHVVVSNDPKNRIFYWDQRPGLLADGRLLDVFWTYDNQAGEYLNIHARESLDNGRKWSDFWDTGLPGQPAAPVSMPDGRIALVYVDRTAQPVIKLRASSDNGRTWPENTERIIYDSGAGSQTVAKSAMKDAWAEMADFSVGLPATALTPDGDLLVVYYAGETTDRTNVQWACIR